MYWNCNCISLEDAFSERFKGAKFLSSAYARRRKMVTSNYFNWSSKELWYYIPHETLLAKMKCKGFSETVVEWFKPYLTDEMFLFQLTIFYSVPHTCTCAYQELVHYQELVPFSTLIYCVTPSKIWLA